MITIPDPEGAKASIVVLTKQQLKQIAEYKKSYQSGMPPITCNNTAEASAVRKALSQLPEGAFVPVVVAE
jgi:ribonuclease HI